MNYDIDCAFSCSAFAGTPISTATPPRTTSTAIADKPIARLPVQPSTIGPQNAVACQKNGALRRRPCCENHELRHRLRLLVQRLRRHAN
nr:hypothetical protein PFGPPNCM_00234 [Paraburkholderia sp.]